jgi:hypothetical protein
MEWLGNGILLLGVASVGLLWTFSIAGGISILWETFGDHAASVAERFKG